MAVAHATERHIRRFIGTIPEEIVEVLGRASHGAGVLGVTDNLAG